MGQSLTRLTFYPLDSILDRLQGYFLPSKPGGMYLEGNFRPVTKEYVHHALHVQGEIPEDLRGEFVRNGPNPKFIPKGGYHWFDGDGMLHGVRFQPDGSATYVNRWTRTRRFIEETKANRHLFIRIGEMHGKLGLLKILTASFKSLLGAVKGTHLLEEGTANTSVHYHDGTFMALVENDKPLALRILLDGQFEEIGKLDYEGKLKHPFTAHPKNDPITKEMMFFGYNLKQAPYVQYSVVSEDGKLLRTTDIGIKRPIMMHDFAITENYSLFMDHPLEFEPTQIISGKFAFNFRTDVPSRIGVIPRHSNNTEDVKWFEFNSSYVFHTAASWEEGDEIVLICCRSETIQLNDLINCTDIPYLYEYRINLVTGDTSEGCLLSENDRNGCEFPTIHPDKLGRKTKYCYVAELIDRKFSTCAKIDIENKSVEGRISFGEGRAGGECVFVPKVNGESEDDGYLLTFVYDEETDGSTCWVMDAKTMAEEPIAIIELPQRVPYGFHGIWVSEDKINNQKM